MATRLRNGICSYSCRLRAPARPVQAVLDQKRNAKIWCLEAAEYKSGICHSVVTASAESEKRLLSDASVSSVPVSGHSLHRRQSAGFAPEPTPTAAPKLAEPELTSAIEGTETAPSPVLDHVGLLRSGESSAAKTRLSQRLRIPAPHSAGPDAYLAATRRSGP